MSWSSGDSSRASSPELPDPEATEDVATVQQIGGLLPDPPSTGKIPKTAEAESVGSITRTQPTEEKAEEPVTIDKITKLLKGKEREWTAVAEKKGPLRLLDLPVDILQEIITHVSVQYSIHPCWPICSCARSTQLPNTNDLTSLALCHSALHSLTIPHIYARFDIVWPPNDDNDDRDRAGVDALTYGLATLVMTEELFGEAPWQRAQRARLAQGQISAAGAERRNPVVKLRRRGNNFAKYTKKFSLGNGPPHWVQEYLITKECGKMLGTLVAIAIAKMQNLETFIWDMPTGVLREVWLALSSLADREDGEDCRLNKVWVRWHDNEQASLPPHLPAHVPTHHQPPPPPPPMAGMPPPPPPASGAITQPPLAISAPHISHSTSSVDRVEHPTFSTLPPLKSLSVLDIDEQAYLDEMSLLIGRSQDRLRELRVGLAKHVYNREWQKVWTGETIQQVDYSTEWTISSRIGEKRLGGVMGTLVGRVYNLNNNSDMEKPAAPNKSSQPTAKDSASASSNDWNASSSSGSEGTNTPAEPEAAPTPPTISGTTVIPASSVPSSSHPPLLMKKKRAHLRQPVKGPCLSGKLKLETLELERVPLSVVVLQKSIDWSNLTMLTLLSCQYDDHLWKALRQTYSPRDPNSPTQRPVNAKPSKGGRAGSTSQSGYRLSLKKIHVNQVSMSLITFLKETIAPNSLEVLFLQEARGYTSLVSVDTIFKSVIKRHRESLKKVMIDSGELLLDGTTAPSQRWKRWILNREILDSITSGRMKNLRELGVSIEYRDWVGLFYFYLNSVC